jgi:hypothetical protein
VKRERAPLSFTEPVLFPPRPLFFLVLATSEDSVSKRRRIKDIHEEGEEYSTAVIIKQ